MKAAISVLTVTIAAVLFSAGGKRFDHPVRDGLPVAWREHAALEGLTLARYYCQDRGFADVLRVAPGKPAARAARMWDKPCEGACEVFDFIECSSRAFDEEKWLRTLPDNFFVGEWRMFKPTSWNREGDPGASMPTLEIRANHTWSWPGSGEGSWKPAEDGFAVVLTTGVRQIRVRPDTERMRSRAGDSMVAWDGFIRSIGLRGK